MGYLQLITVNHQLIYLVFYRVLIIIDSSGLKTKLAGITVLISFKQIISIENKKEDLDGELKIFLI